MKLRHQLERRLGARLANVILAFLLGLASVPAHGWNKGGHMVSGALAFMVLQRDSPSTIPRVARLLRQHPEYESRWRPRLGALTGPHADDMSLFMLAARWPDDIRGDPRYDHGAWHYINLPYVPDGQPADLAPPAPREPNIVTALRGSLDTLRSGTSDREKAISLCWLFHLVGDIHQPLHAASLFSTVYPYGDAGGNKFYVRARPDRAPIRLHAFWDDLIIGTENPRSARNRATELLARPAFSRARLDELARGDPADWAKAESFALAKQYAYRFGALQGTRSADDPGAPVLPASYAPAAKEVAARQVVLSGYRLADELKRLFP